MKFQIIAVDAGRNIVSLDLQAATASIALDAARKQGLAVLSVRPRSLALPRLQRESKFPITLFSIELMALLEAGLNLVEALQTLSEKELNSERQAVLSGVLGAIYRGESFSHAVSRFPQHFPPLYVATLKASERTGNVREALSRYIAYQEEIDRVRKKIVSASIYPAILIAVGSLVLAFLMFYVVPRFAGCTRTSRHSCHFFRNCCSPSGAAFSSMDGLSLRRLPPRSRAAHMGCRTRSFARG